MNENINLCKILKGHEGEKFYCSLFGEVKLSQIEETCEDYPIEVLTINIGSGASFTKFGQFCGAYENSECVLFPSKDQRDWNKWAEEQKSKTPKTWNELIKSGKFKQLEACIAVDDYDKDTSNVGYLTPIEKAALALLKIHQLIEMGYGGNITNDEWKDKSLKYVVAMYCDSTLRKLEFESLKFHIAFHTAQQRAEFLSYPENVQLIKDFYMI